MIGRRRPPMEPENPEPKGFDDFDLRLGDVMRGERATIGKSLLDVQRELKIKAAYIAAIENADTSAFETPGFIAGYVRSYARYLGLDPDWAYGTFCEEANFVSATTLEKSTSGSSNGPVFRKTPGEAAPRDPFAQPRVSFAPPAQGAFAAIEPRAIGSTLVLFALIGAIGYGGWSVLQEVQRVQVTPVDRAPTAVADMDPLEGATFAEADIPPATAGISTPTPDALYRLYRPEALDAPVMVARDGPIASLDPNSVGTLSRGNQAGPGPELISPGFAAPADPGLPRAPSSGSQAEAIASAVGQALGPTTPRVTADIPEVMLVAVRDAWVRVKAADGTVLHEKIIAAGTTYVVPAMEEPPTLRVGDAGALYFTVNGQTHGPAGARGAIADKIALGSSILTEQFAAVDPADDTDAREAVQVAEAALSVPAPLGSEETPAAD